MKKSDILKKKKRIKAQRRARKIKKQHNYEFKTHKGTSKFDLQENIRRAEREEKEEKLKIKKMEGMFK
ncbi:unnamed protein product [marine sediment metagenome]|uniref:Uncharacterized protein n=1 Tax=marine sediment metagenome TaxID=412755 RepID=X1IEN6_9ZZZZ